MNPDRPPSTGDSQPPCPSFEAFYRRTHDTVADTARRLCGTDHSLADEVTQVAYVEMVLHWSERQQYSPEANRRYVRGIMIHKIADHFRYWRRFAALDETCLPPILEHDIELDRDNAKADYRTLLRIIDQQPPRRRAIAIMYFLEELEPVEIAAILDLAGSTVRTQIARTRSQLRPHAERLRDTFRGDPTDDDQ